MINFLEPWYPVDPDEKADLEREFCKELHPAHVLFGKAVELIGRRCDCDDVLFTIKDTPDVAVVHLTWKRSRESSVWPSTEIMTTATFLMEMQQEHAAW